jgi:hypothetical protein
MSHKLIKESLLVDLSDEQQEVLAGGVSQLGLVNISANHIDTVFGTSQSFAGPKGASANSMGGAQSVDSASISALVASTLNQPLKA